MKKLYLIIIVGWLCVLAGQSQPADLVLSSAESGTKLHQATNSITFAAGYSYTPSGGTMTAEIVSGGPSEPGGSISGNIVYSSPIDPSSYSINTSLAVGKTPGSLAVGGSASYNLPLDVPKGTNGLQPGIRLNYTSTFSDGPLGIGWNMGGIPAISRVGETIYHDGKSGSVRGDLTDKYALDGKRLIVVNGTYGAATSEYRTEIEEFSKVVASGSTGYGPASFTVYTKSGLVYEFGNTADSKVTKTNGAVLSWKVSKISDRYNNYISFTYLISDDERPIGTIEYTGNSALSKTPFARIVFNYKYRADISRYVYGGKEFIRDILLDNIEVRNNGQTFKKYALAYMRDTHAQLLKVTETSSQDAALNPTVFAWTQQTGQLTQIDYYIGDTTDELLYVGDFNGDGREDLVTAPKKTSYTPSDKWKLYLSNASGAMVYTAQGDLNAYFETFLVADFNGDGLTDLMMQEKHPELPNYPDKKYFYFYKSQITGFTRATSYYNCSDVNRVSIVDYNGDGILEFARFSESYSCFLYSLSGSIIYRTLDILIDEYYLMDKNSYSRILDFNGDGRSDLLVLYDNGYKIFEFKGPGNELVETYSGNNLKKGDFLLFGDYNGDGAIDIIKREGPYPLTSGDFYMLSLTSGGFQSRRLSGFNYFNLNTQNNRVYAHDVNADGKDDVILVGRGTNTGNSYNRINVALSTGSGFNLTEYTSTTVMQNGSDRYFNFNDFNGDGRYQLFYKYHSTTKLFSFASGTPSHLLSTVIDGLGAKSTISYLPMSNSAVYTRGTGAAYPVSDFSSPFQLVSQVSSDNGIGGMSSVNYQYAGAKVHRQGKGFMGFSKVTASNSATGISSESHYDFDGTYYFPKLRYAYTKHGSTILSTTNNTWNVTSLGGKRIFPYISPAVQTDNLTGLSVSTTASYNAYGNPTSIAKNYGGGHTQTTTYAYNNELTGSWLIGRPSTITETSVRDGQTKTFTTTRTYFSTNNSPDVDNYNTGDAAWWKLDRAYDSFGNLSETKKETTGLSAQTTTYGYDPDHGVNLLMVTDPAGLETGYTYYPTIGSVHTQTDPFGNMTTYSYNTADQLSSLAPTGGITATMTSSLNVTGGPTHARYYIQKSGNDGSLSKTWYDKLGRELRTETKNFGGSMVKVDKQYNAKGQLSQVSEPTTGTPSNWNIMGYDNYGRMTTQDPHFGATTSFSYSGTTSTRTVNGRSYTSTVDAAGLATQRTDPGGTISYAYWPDGTLKSTVAPGSITTEMAYDKNGNRLTIDDPSAGIITNTYYGTGQPKSVKNADNETTTYYYQTNGLLDYYTSPEGTTNYSYNPDKLVSSIASPGGVSRSYTYDTRGRVSTITESIGGISNLVTFNYDSKGRLYRKYFNGTTDYEQYDYNSNGYLYRIQFNGTTVWQLTGMDEYGHTTNANIGSTAATWSYDSNNMLSQTAATGVQRYDYSFNVNTGNLNSRGNFLKSKTESFGYDTDNLDRLITVTGPVNQTVGYTTNKNGNILSKSDAGTFAYNLTPYAVSDISNHQNISSTPQLINYYSFEKVKDITEGTKTAEFVYNADHKRIRMTLKTSGATTKTRWYFGSNCEREQVGSTVTQTIWIGGDAYTAVAVAKKVGTGSWTVYNIFRDHLGTITHLKNGSNPADEYSFDAWGRRRDKDTWSYTLDSEPALFADRGFTSHEYLDDFKLYNMNGRLYDPVVGRFLNPDPYVQDPGFTQNYNRYSYCLNNPLKYTDPSGQWRSGGIAEYFASGAFMHSNMHTDGAGGFDSGNGGGSVYGGPGYGDNGPGASGVYYDWYSGYHRSTSDGSYVPWQYAYNVASQYGNPASAIIFSGTQSNPYETFRGVHYADGSSWYVGEGYTESYVNHGWSGEGSSWGDESFWGDMGFARKSWDWILAGGPATNSPVIGGTVPLPNIGRIGTYAEMAKLTKGFKGEIQAHHLVEARHLERLGLSASTAPTVVIDKVTHQTITNTLRTEMPYGKNIRYTREQMMNAYQKVYPSQWLDYVKILLGY